MTPMRPWSRRGAAILLMLGPVGLLPAASPRYSAMIHSTPLVMQGPWAVVQVRLNGDPQPYRFIVDSAAGASVVDERLARQLAARTTPTTGSIQGASGSETAFQSITLKRLHVAGIGITALSVAVTDMARFGEKEGQHYDGILGADVLGRYTYVFDVPAGRLTFIDRDRPDPRYWSRCMDNPLLSRPGGANGFLAVPVALAPGKAALGIVDTGAKTTVLNWPAAHLKGLSAGGPGVATGTPLSGFDPHSATPSYSARINGASIGKAALPDFDARLSDLAVFDGFGLKTNPGVIVGVNVWRRLPFAAARGAKTICLQT